MMEILKQKTLAFFYQIEILLFFSTFSKNKLDRRIC